MGECGLFLVKWVADRGFSHILQYFLIIKKITNYFQVIKNKNLNEMIHHFVLLF